MKKESLYKKNIFLMPDIDLISGNKLDSELNSREIKGILAREIVERVVRGCLDKAVNLAKEIVNK